MLLATTAHRLYWAARYLERAEDMARIIRTFHDLVVDLDSEVTVLWEPLATSAGVLVNLPSSAANTGVDAGEMAVNDYLIADRDNPSSILNSVRRCRDNLRVTREVMPREAWQTVNSLSQYVDANAAYSVARPRRNRFLDRVIDDSRRFEGVLDASMSRNDAYRMLRLGRLLERADMTTRVLGVRAAELLQRGDTSPTQWDGVQWMGVLRSLSALQMYQRATHSAISGPNVMRFLLHDDSFPRSISGCLGALRRTVVEMPKHGRVLAELDHAVAVLQSDTPMSSDGAALDEAMERIQTAVAQIDEAIYATYIAVGDGDSDTVTTSDQKTGAQ